MASNNYKKKISEIKLLSCNIPFRSVLSVFVFCYKSSIALSFTAADVHPSLKSPNSRSAKLYGMISSARAKMTEKESVVNKKGKNQFSCLETLWFQWVQWAARFVIEWCLHHKAIRPIYLLSEIQSQKWSMNKKQ